MKVSCVLELKARRYRQNKIIILLIKIITNLRELSQEERRQRALHYFAQQAWRKNSAVLLRHFLFFLERALHGH